MNGNTLGHILQLTTFGESHGPSIGGILTGVPAGLPVSLDAIQAALDRRKPGQSSLTTQRRESDTIQILSGVFEGKTTGTPVGFMLPNEDQRSADYEHLKEAYRPSHADYTYQQKYGIRDYRGGGRASARETACRVAAGAIVQPLLTQAGIRVQAYVSAVGPLQLNKRYTELDLDSIDDTPVRCPDPDMAAEMIRLIEEVRRKGDSVGGIITGVVSGMPVGLGEPVFHKLHAALGHALLGINAVKGFEYGMGFDGAGRFGSEVNDLFENREGNIITATNHSGGIQGGISNGMDITFRLAFKPVATIMHEQPTVDTEGNPATVQGKGRHDPCVLPRAVPIVEAMTTLVLADYLLIHRTNKL